MFRKTGHDEDLQIETEVRTGALRGLYCSGCLEFITDERSSIEVRGAHTHTCTNPAGVTFTIGCFREAPGCGCSGTPTPEFSWFPGYRWDLALCTACGKHLGWGFHGGADGFFGLIVDELVSR